MLEAEFFRLVHVAHAQVDLRLEAYLLTSLLTAATLAKTLLTLHTSRAAAVRGFRLVPTHRVAQHDPT